MDIKKELIEGTSIYELPLKVCYYARVSTDHELQATSIVNQVDFFIKYIQSIPNWTLTNGYIDEGISGKEVQKRENFLKMIAAANTHKFDLILTKSVSRFARNTIDSIYYTNLLLDQGIGVFFLNDNINTFYSDSEFRLTLMASIAQDELRKLSESVKFGLRQSINRGIVLGNNNLLGYHKENGKLTIIPKEATIVREIFQLFITNHYTYSQLSKIINQKYNKKFTSTSIKRILTNYKYKGYYCGHKSEIINYKKNKRKNFPESDWLIYKDTKRIPPIIEESIWDQANKQIQKRYTKSTVQDKYSNKIYCQVHGKLTSKRKKYQDKMYYYYTCPKCCHLSSNLLDRICKDKLIKKIIITKQDEIRLDIIYEP